MKALPLFLLFLSGAALADDAAVLKCRALADSAARLACYDGIQLGATSAAPVAVAAAAAPGAVAVAAPPARKDDNFGIEARKVREQETKSVTSTVVGDFQGWGPGSQIRLSNGQVWRVIDGSEAVLPRTSNQKVTIERNLFGTLFLKAEGSNSSAKVRRVQ